MDLNVQWECWKGGHCKENWITGAGEPMSDKSNGLGQCEVKNFAKLSWRLEVVSMVLFSKWIYCIYYAYKGVINFKNY